jgi:polyhydroxyalkanoate synthesis regulator phasin
MRKAVRTYLELALGVTDTSTKKVRKAVEEAVGKGGATADQIKALTSDLMAARSANREGISKLVRFEVDRALGVVGLATADEVSELTARVRDLERQLREAETRGGAVEADPGATAARRAANKKATTKRATASTTLPESPATTMAAEPASTMAAEPASTTAAEPARTTPARTTAAKRTAPRKTAKAVPSEAVPSRSAPKKTAPSRTAAKKTVANKTVRKAQP